MAASRTMVVLMIVVASVCLDVCKACGECGTPSYKPPRTPTTPKTPRAPSTKPRTPPSSPAAGGRTCPVALAELSVCSPLLGGLLASPSSGCCALLNLLGVDIELCLCLALDANILGLITIDARVNAVASILTSCGYKVPSHLSCPF